MNPVKSEAELEREFLETSLARSRWLESGDPERANEAYDKIHALKNQLRKLPDRGEAALKRITMTDDLNTRIIAAASLLAVDEDFAIKTLQEVADLRVGLESGTAAVTLGEWRAGRLREYWG